ncbi:MAG TPA: sigma-54 dependent transcriptional regulator [Syntrophales bacterium]|nr:sigma-54 dependent transcriptional regulator [Syntrophales bacterium]HQN79132.1 sigma-54 dependent transcriptional regulator [Syntrophales bacterium]HQQ28334.1 sigma-54 dependent transcriptional regulator [Syntrophales bacterium]
MEDSSYEIHNFTAGFDGTLKSILVISEDGKVFQQIRESFRGKFPVDHVTRIEGGLESLKRKHHDFVFVDLPLLRASAPGNGYKGTLQPFWMAFPDVQVIVMASSEAIREAVMAVKAGASNYLTYPINPEEMKYVMESINESLIVQSELDYFRDKFWVGDVQDIVRTRSPEMRKVFEKVRSVAPTKSTVLLLGETGTGKGVVARLIHQHSNRRNTRFISVHCGAIPDTLLESELFGHEKGAFTGAVRRQLGKFEIAKGGTIFLDEIGTITPSAQIKLLQVLQDGIFQRVGGEGTIEADVRVIAASNIDLKAMGEGGAFRKDLYYRLNVFPIEIPPLRERTEDIPLLIDQFLKKLNQSSAKEIKGVHPEVLKALERYGWPGNIRELENLIERAYIIESSSVLTPESFPGELFSEDPVPPVKLIHRSMTLADARQLGIEYAEKYYLKEILEENRGIIADTAKAAGITTRQISKLLRKYGLRKEDFKETGEKVRRRKAGTR